jgi:hypothetical protein
VGASRRVRTSERGTALAGVRWMSAPFVGADTFAGGLLGATSSWEELPATVLCAVSLAHSGWIVEGASRESGWYGPVPLRVSLNGSCAGAAAAVSSTCGGAAAGAGNSAQVFRSSLSSIASSSDPP